MSARGLYVFEHSSGLGEAPAQRLFERIRVEKKPGVESPRSFSASEGSKKVGKKKVGKKKVGKKSAGKAGSTVIRTPQKN